MSVIELTDVNKAYNPGLLKKKVLAVRNLSLAVKAGEVFGLVGPNGAGKSTTIRLLLGLIRPDSGMVQFCGYPLKKSRLHNEIGYLSETPYLYDHLTLEELLKFCGKVSGLSSPAISRRSAELMSKLGMTDARKQPLRTFSKGMLQRAGICFALLHDPSVVIFDEPMSGLDPVGRKMVFDLVTDLKSQEKTIFFCSHILNDVERLCDRIGFMVKGKLRRVLDRECFARDDEALLHLEVSTLDEKQRNSLKPLVASLTEKSGNSIVSFPAANFFIVAEKLHAMGIVVRSGRNERLSLEEIFMQTVGGGEQ